VLQKLHSTNVKCIKLFFNFHKRYNVAAVFMELGLPTLSTLVHNAKFRHYLHVSSRLVHNLCADQLYVYGVGAMQCAVQAPSQPIVMPMCIGHLSVPFSFQSNMLGYTVNAFVLLR